MSGASVSTRRTVIWYGFTIFLSSAILLVLEIVAGRLIAPYVGVSLYSWTSIIGVILAGLSLGNWLGGRWADRGGSELSVGIVLLLAAVFSIGSLMFLSLIAPFLQQSQLDLISASFLYVLGMFFIPAVLLGIPTPLLTTLALGLDNRTGHIVGRMHALAALGSILGTFVTGYWLIQYFGTRVIIIGCAVVLVALAAPFLRRVRTKQAAFLVVLAVGTLGVTHVRNGFANPCERESNYFCMRVVDVSQPSYGPAKALILDHLMHGINHEFEPAMMISPYVHAMDEIMRVHFKGSKNYRQRYFFMGGGAYTQPRAVSAMYPEAQVTVAELDPLVTATARESLFVDTSKMEIIHRDARAVLQSSQQQYDVVVADGFHDISVPYHLVTKEFAQSVKSRLAPDGLYLINIIDLHPDPKLVKSMVKTLQTEFQFVDVWLDKVPFGSARVTYVISAQNSGAFPDAIASQTGFPRHWQNVKQRLVAFGTSMAELPLLTDDFVPVERLLADMLFAPGDR